MSEMNTAKPRIPSLATAGIAVLSLKFKYFFKKKNFTQVSLDGKFFNTDKHGIESNRVAEVKISFWQKNFFLELFYTIQKI